MKSRKVLFVISEDWALISHRLHLVDEAILKGYEVGLATHITKYHDLLESHGIKVFHWRLNRKSLNPFLEIKSFLALCYILWLFKPNIIHAVAKKPVIYAGLARMIFTKASFVSALGGVGFIFNSKTLKAKILKPIIKLLLKLSLLGNRTRLIIQNKDNLKVVQNLGILDNNYIRLIKGAGVEIDKFTPSPIPNGIPIVILPARMLWDKGVNEFVKVAKRIKARGIKSLFVLVGDIDFHNPETIEQKQIDKWVASGVVKQWNRRNDIEKVYRQASIVCLPSYNEGLPKVLIEAGSCSRPVVAFDVPGCREVIKNGVNGYLVEFGNEDALETAIINLIKDKELRIKMGKKGRKIVEANFSSKIINTQTFNIWNEVS